MNIQTIDLIHFLPITKETKEKLLSDFDSLNEDQKLAISKICWKMYYALYDARVQQEIQNLLYDAEEKPEKLSKEEVKKIEQNIHDEFKKAIAEKKEERSIGKVREDLESLIEKSIETPQDKKETLEQPPEAPELLDEKPVAVQQKSEFPRETIMKIRSLLDKLESQFDQ